MKYWCWNIIEVKTKTDMIFHRKIIWSWSALIITGISHVQSGFSSHQQLCLFHSLTHWGRDKMAAISQKTLSIAFFVNENVRISIEFSLKFVPKGPINNIPALVQIMAWRRPGDKPLSEPMMVSVLTHICVTRPQWVIVANRETIKFLHFWLLWRKSISMICDWWISCTKGK